MVDIAVAVRRWKQSAERAPAGQHPTLWVGHYDGDELLGWADAPQANAELVLMLGSPFATAEIPSTVIIIDHVAALSVTRLSWKDGTLEQHWMAPYGIDDAGRYSFDVAVPCWWLTEWMERASRAISMHRTTSIKYEFETAFGYAVEAAKELL